jgi:acetyl esterase/lipase
MIRPALALLAALGLAAPSAATMKWPDLFAMPKPAPDRTIPYGADPLQHVDLWLPAGKGPFPVVLMVHGGCWQTGIAKADIMNWIAGDLRQRGIAVWNVEYRGVDVADGGFPGTFRDVETAADLLARQGGRYHLRTSRVVAVGHSAGGHLALWLAARPGLPTDSPLRTRHPLRLVAAISLGGLPDLAAAASPPGDTCGADAVPRLVGRPAPARPDVYADTSPAVLPQPDGPVTLVNGGLDPIAPPAFAAAYTLHAPAAQRLVVADQGHVELITPGTPAWTQTVPVIERALGSEPR